MLSSNCRCHVNVVICAISLRLIRVIDTFNAGVSVIGHSRHRRDQCRHLLSSRFGHPCHRRDQCRHLLSYRFGHPCHRRGQCRHLLSYRFGHPCHRRGQCRHLC